MCLKSFSTSVSLFTTIVVRLILSVLIGVLMGFGVIGIALAMGIDWTVRGILFVVRLKKGKWKRGTVIEGQVSFDCVTLYTGEIVVR